MNSNSETVTKQDWFFVIGLVFSMWAFDQVTKIWAWNTLGALEWFGPFGLVRHRNPGAMLGIFSDLPPLLRVVSLSTGGAFLVFIYMAIQYLLPRRQMSLRVGMSLLLGGILGNVTDRIFEGSVVDFLVIGRVGFSTPAFNVADVVQWVGYIMIVANLIVTGQQIWPDNNERKRIWVNPNFQMKYIAILIAVGSAFSLIVAVFSFTYLKIVIDELVVGNALMVEKRFIFPFIVTFSVIVATFLLILFILGRILSHRTAGPIYAFEKFLDDLMSGKDRQFKMRAGDEFPQLKTLSERLRVRFRELGQTKAADAIDPDQSLTEK